MNISDIQKYKKFIENGDFQNYNLQRLSDRYSQQEQESISHYDIIINSTRANTIIKDGIEYKCIVDYGNLPTKSSVANNKLSFNHEVVTRRSDLIKSGDVVEFSHNPYSEKHTYLLINTVETKDGFDLSTMQKCISTLKWLDTLGEVKEVPFTYRDLYRGVGVDSNQIISSPQERRYIYTQKNEDTLELRKGNTFIFDERAWRVSAFDKMLPGIIYFELEEYQINPAKDNLDLRITNYFETEYKIIVKNGPDISIDLNQTFKLDVEVLRNGENLNTNEIVFSSSDDNILWVDATGILRPKTVGQSFITVQYKDSSTTIVVNVKNTQYNNLTVEIVGDSSIYLGKSKEYKCLFKNNGYTIDENPIFSLTAPDGVSPTPLSRITSQSSNSCVVSVDNQIGIFILHVRSSNGLITGKKAIQIKSFI